MTAVPVESDFASYRRILILAAPLILSQTSVMLMQIIDGLLLAWYSPDAIAAMGPGGLAFWAVICLFTGTAGYCSTFVAQYIGAGRPQRVGASVWQGLYLALAGGAFVMLLAPLSHLLFAHLGHRPAVAAMESNFFRICCLGAPLFALNAAMSGFFAGRNDNAVLMIVQGVGCLVTGVLDWLLIFGRAGLPEMGIAGAAVANVTAQGVTVALMTILMLRRRHRRAFGTWSGRKLDFELLRRIVQYGFPNGVRMLVEVLVWTLFIVFVGRVDRLGPGLAATSIVFRLNTLAFFPIIGMSIAVAMLVGQAQGAGRPDLSARVVWRGLLMSEVWMAAVAAVFVFWPGPLVDLFLEHGDMGPAEVLQLHNLCITLLRFVAVYTLLDALNVVVLGGLQGAGDARWTLLASGSLHLGFLALLVILDNLHGGVLTLWTAATAFVMTVALVWLVRFRTGAWRDMRVIEHTAPGLSAAA